VEIFELSQENYEENSEVHKKVRLEFDFGVRSVWNVRLLSKNLLPCPLSFLEKLCFKQPKRRDELAYGFTTFL